jgi:hypothetical protein
MHPLEPSYPGDQPQPGPYPGRDLPPPAIDEPPDDGEPDHPPMRDPQSPESIPAKIAWM